MVAVADVHKRTHTFVALDGVGRILGESDEESRELKLLVDRYEVLVAQRVSTINRLRWRVLGSETPRCGCSSMASLRRRCSSGTSCGMPSRCCNTCSPTSPCRPRR